MREYFVVMFISAAFGVAFAFAPFVVPSVAGALYVPGHAILGIFGIVVGQNPVMILAVLGVEGVVLGGGIGMAWIASRR